MTDNDTISFDLPKGMAEVDELEFQITQELIDLATAQGWSGCEMFAEAISRALPPEACNIVVRVNGKVGRRKWRMNDDGYTLQ
jgi:hypothetical protein